MINRELLNSMPAKMETMTAAKPMISFIFIPLSAAAKEPLIKCAFYDPTFPQGLKPIDSLSFMYGLKPVPFKSPT